ncbi:zinc-dependent alcohol dehydrogenase family protein [Candidatus Pantoea multigeneris]|uniref:NAD(P)-dependent alcohol dehydrogenase n=1 Tax=Candidatus Pantoea multigeneris TaxID=2608357 RepID=A0ABX0RGJ8_9GAMM|nr:NAD(P)-dependent alcohol dehydrogenase [Pantoea multigeneris]NIF24450.1 NAD(P)-dependent alcohol dehydrogenase [Pantoea multigeneris]
MYSYRLHQFGPEARPHLSEEPVPQPLAHQVLLRITACSLNYRDLAILRAASTLSPKAGLIPLSDGVGEVIATGESVSLFRPGDRVAGCFFPHWQAGPLTAEKGRGTYGSQSDGWLTQYKVVDEQALVAIPDYLSDVEAATLPCAAVTAWNSIQQSCPLQPGETLLIQGTGGVSLFALQFARLMGVRVIALTSDEQKAALLRQLGANEVINYRQHPNWSSEVRRLTHGRGVDRVVEIGGPGTLQQSLLSCASGAEIALLGFVAKGDETVDFFTLFKSGTTVRPFSVGSRDDFIAMNRALTTEKLRPVVDKVFPFTQAVEAWDYFEQRQHIGKVVIRFTHE